MRTFGIAHHQTVQARSSPSTGVWTPAASGAEFLGVAAAEIDAVTASGH